MKSARMVGIVVALAAAALGGRAEAQVKWVPVPAAGVQIEAPADTTVTELFEGTANVSGKGFSVNVSKGSAAMGYEFALSEAESSPMGAGKIKAFTKKEKRPDGGWALEWTYAVGQGDLFGVSYRVMVGGQPVDCKTTRTESAEQAGRVAKACAGLKKL
jgi:hypothetical protein